MPSEHYSFGLFLLQMNSNFSVGLDTKWPKGIWTCWTRWFKKFRRFTTTEQSDSTISQLNMKGNKNYNPKRKTRKFTLWLDVLLVLCTPWVALYSICTVNNTKNKEAGKFPLLANSRINCRLRVERSPCSYVQRSVPHVDDWSLIGVPGFEKRWEVLSELIALWWTVIVGFQSVSVRLSSIVRQRISLPRSRFWFLILKTAARETSKESVLIGS